MRDLVGVEEVFRHALLCRKTGGVSSRGAECDRLWTLDTGPPWEQRCMFFNMFPGLTVNLPIGHWDFQLPYLNRLIFHPHSPPTPVLPAGEQIPLLGKPAQEKRTVDTVVGEIHVALAHKTDVLSQRNPQLDRLSPCTQSRSVVVCFGF